MKTIKRTLAVFLTLLMLISTVPMVVFNASATSKSSTDAINWVKSQEGKALDYDGQYGAQCVDLIMFYYQFLGVSPVGGNGCDYASNSLPSGWTRTKGGVPQKGDILVYSGNQSNPYGHVAIFESTNVIWHGRLNGAGNVQKTTNLSYNSSGFSVPYWGCIHPNFSQSTPTITATWKMNNVESISNNDAKIGAVATFSTTITCTEAGFYLGTSQSNLKKNANPDRNLNLTHTIMGASFLMSKYKETLLPGTTYYYKVYVVANGVTYTSPVSSFKTTGSAPTYTLNYNANGGSGAPAAQSGSTTYTITSTIPTRSGYQFLGWSASATAAAAQYISGNSISLTANTTLYAVWATCAHNWGSGVVTTPASCTATGVRTYTCSFCGTTRSEIIEMSAHTIMIINQREATYDAEGYTGDEYCTTCKQIIHSGKVISKLEPTVPPVEDVCKWCGGQHEGFFGGIIGFFHRIFAALFGAKY